jgi:ketosteroid isomerase-like protein
MEWGAEQQNAFEDLNLYLEHLPILSSPEQGQPLTLYVSTTHSVVSRALVIQKEIKRDGKKYEETLPNVFRVRGLDRIQKYYSVMEKICYAVIMSARKL